MHQPLDLTVRPKMLSRRRHRNTRDLRRHRDLLTRGAQESRLWWRRGRVERYQQHGLAVLVAIGSVGLVNNAWTQQLAKGYFGGSG